MKYHTLFFSKIGKGVAKIVVCCSCDRRLKGNLLKMLSAYHVCCIYSNDLQKTFTMKVNSMNPDQTAPEGTSLIWVHTVCNTGN